MYHTKKTNSNPITNHKLIENKQKHSINNIFHIVSVTFKMRQQFGLCTSNNIPIYSIPYSTTNNQNQSNGENINSYTLKDSKDKT